MSAALILRIVGGICLLGVCAVLLIITPEAPVESRVPVWLVALTSAYWGNLPRAVGSPKPDDS